VPHPLRQNVDLTPLNSFAVSASATWYQQVDTVDDVLQARDEASRRQLPLLILGAGSNVLFRGDFPGLVLHLTRTGVTRSDNRLRIGAGEDWHELVKSCLKNRLHGLENLALIPGTVGAAPVQNIGAYGVELAQVFHSLDAINLLTGEVETLDGNACRFAYRSSVFKRNPESPRLILDVELSLSLNWQPQLGYSVLREALQNEPEPGPQLVFDTVCQIRRSKLPDPGQLGNAGSFFKNPVISTTQLSDLKTASPDIPAYPDEPGRVKVPAAWLLEQAGWKGKRRGAAGVHEQHALVLVNHGGASGEQIYRLAMEMRESVQQKFQILLEPEVRIL